MRAYVKRDFLSADPVDQLLAPDSSHEGVDDLVLRDVGELVVLAGEALDVVVELFLALALAIALVRSHMVLGLV